VRRPLAAALILVGCLVLIVEIQSLDTEVIATVWWGRGVHLSDVIGLLIVVAGIAVMWRN
jgi:hypothetical protein